MANNSTNDNTSTNSNNPGIPSNCYVLAELSFQSMSHEQQHDIDRYVEETLGEAAVEDSPFVYHRRVVTASEPTDTNQDSHDDPSVANTTNTTKEKAALSPSGPQQPNPLQDEQQQQEKQQEKSAEQPITEQSLPMSPILAYPAATTPPTPLCSIDAQKDIEEAAIEEDKEEEEEEVMVEGGLTETTATTAATAAAATAAVTTPGETLNNNSSKHDTHQRSTCQKISSHWEWILASFITGLIVGCLLWFFLLRDATSDSSSSNKNNNNPPPLPTNITGSLEATYVLSLLPNRTQQTIVDQPYAPPSVALRFVLQDPAISDRVYPDWRIRQRFALACLYYATNGPHTWKRRDQWLSYDHHECDWYTTSSSHNNNSTTMCSFWDPDDQYQATTQRITHLDLSNNGLQGSLPDELYLLTDLQSLILEANQLQGSLPSSSLGQLSQLTALSVAANDLTGSLPTHLGGMTQLERLDLSNNVRFWLFDSCHISQ